MSKHFKNKIYLSRENRKLLNDISIATGNTTDELLLQEYNNTSVEYARGYLSGLSKNAPEQKILLVYFLLRILINKK